MCDIEVIIGEVGVEEKEIDFEGFISIFEFRGVWSSIIFGFFSYVSYIIFFFVIISLVGFLRFVFGELVSFGIWGEEVKRVVEIVKIWILRSFGFGFDYLVIWFFVS